MQTDRRPFVRLSAEPIATAVVSLAVWGPVLFSLDRADAVSVTEGAGVVLGTVVIGLGIKERGWLPTVTRERASPPNGSPEPELSKWQRSVVTRAGFVFGLLVGCFVGFGIDAALVPVSPVTLPESVRLFALFVNSLTFSWMGVRFAEQFTPAYPEDWHRPLDA